MTRESESKQVLRRQMRARRRAISPIERADLQSAWVSQALSTQLFRPGQKVAVYIAQGSELSLQAFISLALARGLLLFLPRVVGAAPLEFCRYDGQALHLSALGIAEPTGPAIELAQLDLILVPLLAFDLRGQRLGQGGGYYDRTLLIAQALAIGVAFDQQGVEQLPMEPFDQCLDALVTPSKVRFFTQNHLATVPFRGRE